jgi:hypothetical protein
MKPWLTPVPQIFPKRTSSARPFGENPFKQHLQNISASPMAAYNGTGRPQKDLNVHPNGPRSGIGDVHPNHFVELDSAAPLYLPKTCNSGLHSEQAATVPNFVVGKFVGERRPRTDKGHVANQHAEKLRDFVKAGSPEKPAHTCDPRI